MDFSNAVHFPTQGRITHGARPNALLQSTADFIYAQLPGWRDRPDRVAETDEERLNAQLARHLNGCARRENFPVIFQHEEKQTARRRVDIAVTPAGFEGAIVGTTYHAFDEPILVVEGKRLPAPGGRLRKREYVTGEPDITGGIQRFKLGLHGAKVSNAILVAYVQADASAVWHRRINGWIRALARRKKVIHGERWIASEILAPLVCATCKTSRCASRHPRHQNDIQLDHMWVEMGS